MSVLCWAQRGHRWEKCRGYKQENAGFGWAAWKQGCNAISDTLGHLRDPGRPGGHRTFCSGSWARAHGWAASAWAVQMSFSAFYAAIVMEKAAFVSFASGFSSTCFQSLPRNFRKEVVRTDGRRRALSCDEESRRPQWKPNIHIFPSVLASLVVRLNKQFCRAKEPDIEEISLEVK